MNGSVGEWVGLACSLITEEMQQFIVTAFFPKIEALEVWGCERELSGRMDEAGRIPPTE